MVFGVLVHLSLVVSQTSQIIDLLQAVGRYWYERLSRSSLWGRSPRFRSSSNIFVFKLLVSSFLAI